ncbi:AAA domain-containing protein [Streptacidiphilus sp. N1-10]|uniref:AAA domain-containing protein n=1 Tax=Streptacidiphilus jeojiensis TaxID=3229225 RepID=A0ABV6XYG8_9ACTN
MPSRHAGDPEVVAQTAGLIGFLREVVQNSQQRQRDTRTRESLWLAALPDQIARPRESPSGALLSLQHVPREAPPQLPGVLDGWVDQDLCQVAEAADPPLNAEGPGRERMTDAAGRQWWEERTVRREDSLEALDAYAAWLPRWRRWAAQERRDQPLRDLYEYLYRWHQRLVHQDDQLELVLAVGLLTWRDPNGETVCRHLLARRVETKVERRTAKLLVHLSPQGATQLEDQDFLDSDDGWHPEQAAALAEQLTARSCHPLSDEALEQLSQWQERALSRPVSFSAEWQVPRQPELAARLTFAPALLLRPRDRNALLRYYDRIGASVAEQGQAPLGLAQLVLPLEHQERADWRGRGTSRRHEAVLGEDPLFPLKTNPKQASVLARLERDTAVVVQGPPGTGKTHTIANLVSALLAEGKRVLVTSARDQALTVLRDKLPTPVRDLCVLLLSSNRHDGVDELEKTVNALIDQVASSDTDQLAEEIARLRGQRADLRGRIAHSTEQIIALREAEHYRHPEIAHGYGGTLATIIQRLKDQADRLGWIGRLPLEAPQRPPLNTREALELLELLRSGASGTDQSTDLPDPALLPAPQEVAAVIDAARPRESVSPSVLAAREALAALTVQTTDALAGHLESSYAALHQLGLPPSPARWDQNHWTTRALHDRLTRRNLQLWQAVATNGERLRSIGSQIQALGLTQVEIPPDLSPAEAAAMVASGRALRAHWQQGGTFRTRMAPRVQKTARPLLEACTVDGRAPHDLDDLEAVLVHLEAQTALAALALRWAHVEVTLTPGPAAVRLAQLTELTEQIEHIDAFGTARDAIDNLLLKNGVRLGLASPSAWQDYAAAMAELADRRTAATAQQQLRSWERALSPRGQRTHTSPHVAALAHALHNHDAHQYAHALEALATAHTQQRRRHRCNELSGRLHSAHPHLAKQLEQNPADQAWENRLALLDDAWPWACANRFVTDQRTPGLEQRLDAQLIDLEARLERLTGDLAAAQGRLHCLRRMTQDQRSSLQSYRSHMTALGKGKGRSASAFRAAARDAMSVAQEAVPAWVMPIAQVAEMIPARQDAFDVVIIDEASQASMESLFLLWLAPRVIVVGDDKQCAPSLTSMGPHQRLEDRVNAYLPDMPARHRRLFSPHTNLYQLLSSLFPDVIRLDEHFRCMPEIIGWSSATFYDRKLQPLRQYGGERLDPLIVHLIPDAVVEGRDTRLRNPTEAEAIVNCLKEMTNNPAYRDKTIGVVVLQGSGQIRLLENMIPATLGPTLCERHQITVGTPAAFQGDERHIILLSMVVTNPPRITGGNLSERRAYNVAASRAQDQMHLFCSVPPDRLRPKDLRLNLLTYMQNPPAALDALDDLGDVRPDVPTTPFDSLFEQQVYLRLRERGYHVLPQLPAGGKRIDLVVVGARGRLAVECDGDHFHSTPDQIRHDQQRDRELQRVGWTFWRIRESEFRFDADQALEGLWETLDRLKIHPATYTRAAKTPAAHWQPLELTPDVPEDATDQDEETDLESPEEPEAPQ